MTGHRTALNDIKNIHILKVPLVPVKIQTVLMCNSNQHTASKITEETSVAALQKPAGLRRQGELRLQRLRCHLQGFGFLGPLAVGLGMVPGKYRFRALNQGTRL